MTTIKTSLKSENELKIYIFGLFQFLRGHLHSPYQRVLRVRNFAWKLPQTQSAVSKHNIWRCQKFCSVLIDCAQASKRCVFARVWTETWEFRASKSPNFLKSSYSLWTPFKKNLLPTTPPSLDLQRPFLGGPRTVPQAVELPVVTTITDFCKSRLSSNIPCLTDRIMFINHIFGLIIVTTGQNHNLDPF